MPSVYEADPLQLAAAIEYATGPAVASHFLLSQLKEQVWKHPRVLKDSMEPYQEYSRADL